MNGADVDARIKDAVGSYDITAADSVNDLCSILDEISKDLALNQDLR